ncbi:hypothetical protein B6D29_03955 [Microgenomates bacterium UTCPR1]|nr:MAG: hypothetical protein B6D29_03955 [Microgenomates bacterium UTCPR1]
MRIFIITQYEPFYIPKMIESILAKQGKYEVVGYTVLKPHRKNKNMFHWFKERQVLYTKWELFLVVFAYLFVKILTISNLTRKFSNLKIFSHYKIREFTTPDINSDEYLDTIKPLNPDYIVSISCPQLFQDKILELPKIACLNAHGTLLPRHRGVFGSWWTLFTDDIVGGSTIHTMELKLDAGYIVWQKTFEITKLDTQYSIALKTKRDMTSGLIEIFNSITDKTPSVIEPKYESSYHRAPTKKQGKDFYRKGKRVITIRDLFNIFFTKYE